MSDWEGAIKPPDTYQVEAKSKCVLYDAQNRPLYRPIGFRKVDTDAKTVTRNLRNGNN